MTAAFEEAQESVAVRDMQPGHEGAGTTALDPSGSVWSGGWPSDPRLGYLQKEERQ